MTTSSLTDILEETESYRSTRANEAYISEASTPSLIKLGNRIQLATAFNVFNPNYRYNYALEGNFWESVALQLTSKG